MHDEFQRRTIDLVAIAQEDSDLKSHARLLDKLRPGPWFTVLADIDRARSTMYDRITIYIVDAQGIVRQVMPQLIRHRALWQAVLNETDRILADKPGF